MRGILLRRILVREFGAPVSRAAYRPPNACSLATQVLVPSADIVRMTVGFTGSRKGMTDAQKATVARLLAEMCSSRRTHQAPLRKDARALAQYWDLYVHHGDCVGADAAFNEIAESLHAHITVHPPEGDKLRAFCKAEQVQPALPYLERNAAIVAASDVLIATPDGAKEKVRSGTWATIRLARKEQLTVYVVAPDGSVM